MKKEKSLPEKYFMGTQLFVIAILVISYAFVSKNSQAEILSTFSGKDHFPTVSITRTSPLEIGSLYNDPEVVSEKELAMVLSKIRPRFSKTETKPNFVEHALRTWSLKAEFQEKGFMSGIAMRDVLVDHGEYLKSWGETSQPLLVNESNGVSIRWESRPDASVHHDHWLASLTEAGVSLEERVFLPGRPNADINDVLQQSLKDFNLDEREVEWSAMAFGLWLPPVKSWTTSDGRQLSFDSIANRLIRGHQRFGVCSGTHRVYSLMLLLRIDEEYSILSDSVRKNIYGHLENVRDLMIKTQYEDGHWPSNWSYGYAPEENPKEDEDYKKVIATGHHLEWLAIAPKELHPPHEQILKASRWLIKNCEEKDMDYIQSKYTFYSHVGNALALWRQTRPWPFWKRWQETKNENTVIDK